MKYIVSSCLLLMHFFTINAQNVLIGIQNNPNEPSIAINPKSPNILIAGANINNCYVSLDTGRTWKSQILTSSYGVWGDPNIIVDTAGHFYFFHLSNPPQGSWIDRIVCQKTTDNGITWNDGSFTGLNGQKDQDKHWSAVDRRNNNLYVSWTQFDTYGSSNPKDSSNILFSKSTDAGATWSTPRKINKFAGDCIDSDNTVEGAVPAIGPNGEIYISWAGPLGLMFNKSLDEGNTWLYYESVIGTIPGGWDFDVPGIYRANGLPVTACDVSSGPHRGTIYINWADQRNGSSNTDIWLTKSKDGGISWASPKKVNIDNTTTHQFFTWMTIDQTTGYLYFVFYDRRNYTDDQTDVYLAVSVNGGETFTNHRISASSFVPTKNVFFGDYTNITAHNGIIRPIWTRLNLGQLSVWTHLTTLNELLTSDHEIISNDNDLSFENYPNPSKNLTYVSFKVRHKTTINLSVLNAQGNLIKKMIQNESRTYGKYIEQINLDDLNIPNGLYFIKLEMNNKVKVIRQIKI